MPRIIYILALCSIKRCSVFKICCLYCTELLLTYIRHGVVEFLDSTVCLLLSASLYIVFCWPLQQFWNDVFMTYIVIVYARFHGFGWLKIDSNYVRSWLVTQNVNTVVRIFCLKLSNLCFCIFFGLNVFLIVLTLSVYWIILFRCYSTRSTNGG